jgi:hypothetical protein
MRWGFRWDLNDLRDLAKLFDCVAKKIFFLIAFEVANGILDAIFLKPLLIRASVVM